MEWWVWLIIAAAVVVVVAIIATAYMQQRRRRMLQNRLGPEYERAVADERRGRAERQLADRLHEHDELEIRPLSAGARSRYTTEWRDLQTRFVDRPEASIEDADHLIEQVMRERGYPVDDFDRQADLVAVDHPHVVENYRAAHGTYVRNTHERASTEDLREALVCYRSLFEELVTSDR